MDGMKQNVRLLLQQLWDKYFELQGQLATHKHESGSAYLPKKPL